MKDIIIIPTYNEKENIAHIIGRITDLYPNMEVWIVDDNSPDGTADIVRGMMKSNQNIKLLSRTSKSGLGDAYKFALSHVKKANHIRYVVTMDADGSHDPASVKDLIVALEGKDFAVGSRYIKGGKVTGWDKRRLVLSFVGNLYSRLITGSPIKDGTAGFVAFKSKDLLEMDLDSISGAGYAYQIEFKGNMIKRFKTFKEVPIVFTERQLGKSKMSGQIITEGLKMPWRIVVKDKAALKNRLQWLTVGLIFIGALFFSTYKLTESPSVWYDEGWYIQTAANLDSLGIDGVQLSPGNIFHVSILSVGYPLIYPLAFFFKMFGSNVLVARSLMVIFIGLFLFLVYKLSRRIFTPSIALGVSALLTTFPPLYGNGKSVLGEVPGLFYMLLFLIFFNIFTESRNRKYLFVVLAGICVGLAIATKPLFLVLLPAILVGFWMEWSKRNISIKNILAFILAAAVPVSVWVFLQFGTVDSISSIFNQYANPYHFSSVSEVILKNTKLLFSDMSTLYTMFIIGTWSLAMGLRIRLKQKILSVEVISYIFSILIMFAFLRTAGLYRYLFPTQVIGLIFLPSSLMYIANSFIGKFGYEKIMKRAVVALISALVILGAYQVLFRSWVAESYNSHKTAYWQQYFEQASSTQSYFFYDAPEVAIFIKNRNYYQYIIPAGWPHSDKELKVIEEGKVDRIIIRRDYLTGDVLKLTKNYHSIEEPYKYTILEKNR